MRFLKPCPTSPTRYRLRSSPSCCTSSHLPNSSPSNQTREKWSHEDQWNQFFHPEEGIQSSLSNRDDWYSEVWTGSLPGKEAWSSWMKFKIRWSREHGPSSELRRQLLGGSHQDDLGNGSDWTFWLGRAWLSATSTVCEVPIHHLPLWWSKEASHLAGYLMA